MDSARRDSFKIGISRVRFSKMEFGEMGFHQNENSANWNSAKWEDTNKIHMKFCIHNIYFERSSLMMR